MEIKTITDLSEVENIWKELSFDESVFDSWDMRMCFFKEYNASPYFLVAYDDSKPVAVLALQMNNDKNYLEFFGGRWMEDNKVFFKEGYDHLVKELYSKVEGKFKLEDLTAQDEFTSTLPTTRNRYESTITGLNNIEEFLDRNFKSKSKNNFKKKIRQIEELNVEIIEDKFEDIEILFEKNIKNLGENESSFKEEWLQKSFRNILSSPISSHMMTFKIDGKVVAVSLCISYKGKMYYLNAGSDKFDVPNIGTYVVYKNVEKAISLKMEKFDALVNEPGSWKDRWHFDQIPQYLYSNLTNE